MRNRFSILKVITFLVLFSIGLLAQSNFYTPLDIDTVSWSINDFGKMWTFDNVPVEKFEKKYGFKPTQEWLDDVRQSALQFGGGCSGAFVSADGLIMTNHHCGRNQLSSIQKEGENLLKNGFYAETLDDERKVDGLFVDQLMFIEDVTNEIKDFMNTGRSDEEKIRLLNKIKDSLVTTYEKETGLKCRIVTLYNGGKYSLYGYRRYNDIRLVMAPDFQIAATGWDWDNFTYPRYELDFMFYRAYDDGGKPVKCENYFKWSKNGAEEGEAIFVIGRPGRTDRLVSYAQLEFFRDYTFPHSLIGFNEIYKAYFDVYQKHPESQTLLNGVMGWGNARKSYAGRLLGLKNDYIMTKKLKFEKDLISKVNENPELSLQYGEIWNSIKSVLNELKPDMALNRSIVFSRFVLAPDNLKIAQELLKIADIKEKGEQSLTEDELITKFSKYFEGEFSEELKLNITLAHKRFLNGLLGSENDLFKILYKKPVNELLASSKLSSLEGILEIAQLSGEEIKNNKDPFIQYAKMMNANYEVIAPRINELNNTLRVLNQQLGEVIGLVYGDVIPPDATSTLRISDGVIKGYEYNGTIAPGKTTYYGLWDRYESFNKKTYPWGLHERWKKPPIELDLSTKIGFASTNDIVGGNSGSSVINKNKEVVGLVHDGNIESLSGHTIFLEENNRTVATDSDGLMAALKYVYKTGRLVDELLNGKIK